jgi:hypothetical protein
VGVPDLLDAPRDELFDLSPYRANVVLPLAREIPDPVFELAEAALDLRHVLEEEGQPASTGAVSPGEA